MDILSELNPSQRAAVEYNEGPLLIIAGAGSGKTRVLTYKIAYLLQQGIHAGNILALTFTNKAAREMKERIVRLVGQDAARYLWMGTFHSVCGKILRQEADKIGYTRDFSIYDTADSKSVIKQLLKERQLDEKVYKPNIVLGRISTAKNALISVDSYATNQDIAKRDRYDRLYDMAELYRLYQLRLKAANAMDFDDMLMNVCLLFHEYSQTLQYYQNIFKYVLVDEYQDTNYAQYFIVRQLSEPENHICVVGDDAQSIYSFRGADIRNILSFQQGYPQAKVFKLEQNYRSTQTIVNAANSLIHKNEHQIFKNVYSTNEEGDRLSLISYLSDREEAEGVAAHISQAKRTNQVPTYNDIAVLYRTNAQSRAFENELRRLNIPYRIYGGTSFYQRKEIKDAISYFRLCANSKDNEALLRVINFPARGIGETTMKKVSEQSIVLGVSMMDVVAHPIEMALQVSSSMQNKLKAFAERIQLFREAMDTKDAYDFAELVMQQSGILAAAAADKTTEGIDRKQNLDELLSGIHDFVDQRLRDGISFTPIQDFLAEVSLLTDQDENIDDYTPRVTLMTVHSAKGLEFPMVYIVGLEENLFPSQFCTSSFEIEEERRLLYVAITRAKQCCHLTYARQRFKNGSVNFSSPSRFLQDIDRQYLQLSDGSQRMKPTHASPIASMPISRPIQQPKLKPIIKQSASGDYDFQEGNRVFHRVFGEGVIERIYRENDNDKVDIRFDQQGRKTLLLTYAKLEKR